MTVQRVFFLNGPNANLYGLDAKGTYGTESFPAIEARCRKHADASGLDLDFRQSNHEGILIDWISGSAAESSRAHCQWCRPHLHLDRHSRCIVGFREADCGSSHEQYLPARAVPASFLYFKGCHRHRRRPGSNGLRACDYSHVAPARPRRGGMKREALIFYSLFDDADAWKKTLTAELPELEFRTDPAAGDPAEVRYALVWNPPPGFFARFPNLSLVINLGAGVDLLVGRGDLPDVPISRQSDTGMVRLDDELCPVLRHPLCTRYPYLRARAAARAMAICSPACAW